MLLVVGAAFSRCERRKSDMSCIVFFLVTLKSNTCRDLRRIKRDQLQPGSKDQLPSKG